ncbi:hypothetical protein BFJ63_vAg17130 [Fusarium oxysporum f. sp. narcissi]|uniref:RelA/SpoT domain-containing protein n=1 Tax=Fusarium oxysporum f. sp. narcissi TaxID=451672 RepID=A0A4Q2V503_FUSOX|nr:hypothetical protein BFJ63_vAg17130 [Fusarium oxysporum f. sp. narcissi]
MERPMKRQRLKRDTPPIAALSLHEKTERLIQSVDQTISATEAFIDDVWVKIKKDYEDMELALTDYCKNELVNVLNIQCEVKGRVKTDKSIQMSIERRGVSKDISRVVQEVHDLLGLRVVVDYLPDVKKANSFVTTKFTARKHPNEISSDRPIGKAWVPMFGAYKSTNHHVQIGDIGSSFMVYRNVLFEIQVTSLPELLYNRLAHPLLYKNKSGTLSRQEEQIIDISHGLSLCYSICLLSLREKLEENPEPLKGKAELREAMTKTANATENCSTEDLEALNSEVSRLSINTNDPIGSHIASNTTNLSGKTMRVDDVLAALRIDGTDQGTAVYKSIASKIEEVVVDAMKSEITLPTTPRACYGSEDVESSPKCHVGTRVSAMDAVCSWANEKDASSLYWLYAPAGTGKSTLARSLSDRWFSQGQFAAGYFFKRGENDRNTTARIFPTIASQLMKNIPGFRIELRKVLQKEPENHIEHMALKIQFQTLIRTPLCRLTHQEACSKVIVMDALDECKNTTELHRVIELLQSLENVEKMQFRIFLTSRPDSAIEVIFHTLDEEQKYLPFRRMALHEHYGAETRRDIESYLHSRFAGIKKRCQITRSLPESWPIEDDVKQLIRQSTTPTPLFIYAEIAMRFIDDPSPIVYPVKRLEQWLASIGSSASTELNDMYDRIFETQTKSLGLDGQKLVLRLLSSIAALVIPLSRKALAGLLNLDPLEVNHYLANLRSVIDVPSDDDGLVGIFHESFSDFLLHKSTRTDFVDIDHTIGIDCLDRMCRTDGRGLLRNICQLKEPGAEQRLIPSDHINQCIPKDLQYACLYWVEHFLVSKEVLPKKRVDNFLSLHFTHWLEVLSILSNISHGSLAIAKLREFSSQEKSTPELLGDLTSSLQDAERFISTHGTIIAQYPLQTYGSALVFSPPRSRLRALNFKERLKFLKTVEMEDVDWDPHLYSISSNTNGDGIPFAISPDEKTFAYCAKDGLILADINTGTSKQVFKRSDQRLRGIAFVEESKRLVSCSICGVVQAVDIETGTVEVLCTLKGCTFVETAAISQAGSSIAVHDGQGPLPRICLWNLYTGCLEREINYRGKVEDRFKSMDISSTGTTIAILLTNYYSLQSKVYLWDVKSGSISSEFSVFDDCHTVVFCSNDKSLALIGYNDSQFYNLSDGVLAQSFQSPMFMLPGSLVKVAQNGGRFVLSSHGHLSVFEVSQTIDDKGNFQAKQNPLEPTAITTVGNPLKRYFRHVESIHLSHDGKIVAVFRSQDYLLFWNLELQRPTSEEPDPWEVSTIRSKDVLHATFSPDMSTFASALLLHDRVLLNLRDVSTSTDRWEKITSAIAYPTDKIIAKITFSQDGKLLALWGTVKDYNNAILLFEVSTGKFLCRANLPTSLKLEDSEHYHVCITGPEDSEFGTGGDREILPISVYEDYEDYKFQVRSSDNNHISLSNDKKWIMSQSQQKLLRIPDRIWEDSMSFKVGFIST